MGSRRTFAAALSAVVVAASVVLVAPGVASADGPTPVEATCTGIPILGTTTATANVNATDDVDPVTVGGVVNNTLNVPIPQVEVPVEVTVKEVKITVPIPSGVTIDAVTFTPSSFTGQTWGVSGSTLTATFTGNVVIANGGPPPVVPDVKMKTTVSGPPRTIEWKAPTGITAKAQYFLGSFTASCTPTNPNQTLISTVVQAPPNQAPTATDQTVQVAHNTAKAITLSGTDPESSPLSFAATSSPAHGTLSGTAPNLIYTPTTGYSGPDSFTFTASDGLLADTGTVTINVAAPPNTAPTATDQTIDVAYNTATPITLSGTDPQSDPLTFTSGGPSHGLLTGTPPNMTYKPAIGYSGPDSFTFTVSDGLLSDTGTITINVGAAPIAVPGPPAISRITVAEGEATVTWTAPLSNGGSPITGYKVVPLANGVAKPTVDVPAGTNSVKITGLANGVPHTFKVAAVNAVGTGLYTLESSALTPQWWLPWTSGPIAVDEIFTWMTGKAPTSAERTSWLNQLNAGTKLPADLVVALRGGADATTNVDPTVRLYSAYLTRIPDAGGLNFWLNRRRAGWTLSRISNNFAGSSEFIRRYGSMTNRQFVENIYANVLQRPGDPTGINFWTKKLDNKTASRGQVMINFSESNEYKNKQLNNTHAAVVYISLRGKTPTTAERDAFVASLVGGTSLRNLVTAQIHLPAFVDRAS